MVDVLVFQASHRRARKDVACHLYRSGLPLESLQFVGGDIYAVSVPLCALQAAEQLDFWSCVEYYYELCSRYRLPFNADDRYAECRPATSVEELRAYFESHPGMHGSRLARRAITYVRDGARSPMETALMMMLVMPRADGGLGIRDIEMDYVLPVTGYARKLTRSRSFFCDVFIRRALLDVEYGGLVHEEMHRRASDNERTNALRAMGYDVIEVSRQNFFDKQAFRRTMAAICRKADIWPSHLPEDFADRQEELRRFVLRRWSEPDGSRNQVGDALWDEADTADVMAAQADEVWPDDFDDFEPDWPPVDDAC